MTKLKPYQVFQVYDDLADANAKERSLRQRTWLVWAEVETSAVQKLARILDQSPDLFDAILLGSPFCSECGERVCVHCGKCHGQHPLKYLALIVDYLSDLHWILLAIAYRTFFQVLSWAATGFLAWLIARMFIKGLP